MKEIYAWESPFNVPYGDSYVYALANSEDEARSLIIASAKDREYSNDTLTQIRKNLTRPADLITSNVEWLSWSE